MNHPEIGGHAVETASAHDISAIFLSYVVIPVLHVLQVLELIGRVNDWFKVSVFGRIARTSGSPQTSTWWVPFSTHALTTTSP